MLKTKAYISAARLRTLPLSVSGIITGTALVVGKNMFNWPIFILALCTTIGFQILSNFANDYGDGVKGTDNIHRVGPKRALQSGLISAAEMKQAIIITIILTLIMALALIYVAFGTENMLYTFVFLILGVVAIIAAITYTIGKSAYGYHGLGDLFVLLFFGGLSVAGVYFLYMKTLQWSIFLPATTIGLLSTGVLNLNNMRDRESDAAAQKHTLAVILGASYAKSYHICLIFAALLSVILYVVITWRSMYQLFCLLAFFPILMHLLTVIKNKDPKLLDPELKKLALSTFLFSILFLLSELLML